MFIFYSLYLLINFLFSSFVVFVKQMHIWEIFTLLLEVTPSKAIHQEGNPNHYSTELPFYDEMFDKTIYFFIIYFLFSHIQ